MHLSRGIESEGLEFNSPLIIPMIKHSFNLYKRSLHRILLFFNLVTKVISYWLNILYSILNKDIFTNLIVSKSLPAKARICFTFLNEAPITCVL